MKKEEDISKKLIKKKSRFKSFIKFWGGVGKFMSGKWIE